MNACEVYYVVRRQRLAQGSTEAAEDAVFSDLEDDEMRIWEDVGRDFLRRVGRVKTDVRIPFADCFGVALAGLVSGTILTTDRNHFEPVLREGVCAVEFIR